MNYDQIEQSARIHLAVDDLRMRSELRYATKATMVGMFLVLMIPICIATWQIAGLVDRVRTLEAEQSLRKEVGAALEDWDPKEEARKFAESIGEWKEE